MFEKENRLNGSFNDDSLVKSVPTTLLTLISFIVDGSCDSMNKYNQPTLTAAPIITSNIYISLKIYSTVGSKTLIQ